MAAFTYNDAKRALLAGEINWATDDIRVALVMSNTTCDTEDDANTFANFTTVDEFDGSGYASPGIALASKVINEDVGNNRAEGDAADIDFGALGNGTRQIQAAIVYKFVTSLSASKPIAYLDGSGLPSNPNGATFVLRFDAEGILQIG
jgi:hypothetical protein